MSFRSHFFSMVSCEVNGYDDNAFNLALIFINFKDPQDIKIS